MFMLMQRSTHYVHASYSCIIFMEHGHAAQRHVHESRKYSTDMHQGHVALLCNVDMQHGYAAWICSIETWTCIMDLTEYGHLSSKNMDMQHRHGHAAWHRYAAWTWKCSMHMDMQYGYGHVALTWTFIIIMNIQHWHGHTVVVLDMKNWKQN